MTRRSDDFERRFPGYSAQQKATEAAKSTPDPRVVRQQQVTAEKREIAATLVAALPLLREHANFEPYAIPVVRIREHRFRKPTRELTSGWIYNITQTPAYDHGYRGSVGGDWAFWVLTESGEVGVATFPNTALIPPMMQLDGGLRYQSHSSLPDVLYLSKAVSITEDLQASVPLLPYDGRLEYGDNAIKTHNRLAGILQAVGVEFPDPRQA